MRPIGDGKRKRKYDKRPALTIIILKISKNSTIKQLEFVEFILYLIDK